MIEIPLTRGCVTIIDDIDADLMERKWYALENGRTVYCVRNQWVKSEINQTRCTKYFVHREIIERVYGRKIESNEVVDHINGNGLDNRRCNLRLCDQKQNARNRRFLNTTKGGLKGVSYYKGRTKAYKAAITVSGKSIYLGFHTTAEEAHEAYKTAAIKYFGEFARFE